MRRRPFLFAMTLAWILTAARLAADSVPVAPLHPEETPDHGLAYRLESDTMTVTVSPDVGAVISIATSEAGELLASPLRITPLKAAVDKAWEHRAWTTSDGARVVMLTRSLGPPRSLRIVHIIELSAEGTTFRQETRITATGPGDQGLLAPSAGWSVPVPESFWIPARDGSGADCGDWARRDTVPLESRRPVLAYPGIAAAWACAWSLEEPETPYSNLIRIGGESGETFSSRPGSLELPPRGWTLLCRLTLDLARPGPDGDMCPLLSRWPENP